MSVRFLAANESPTLAFRDNLTLREVLGRIDEGGHGFVCLVTDRNKFLRLITDGDVRRLLLAGFDLESSKAQWSNEASKTIGPGVRETEIEQILDLYSIRQIPIVDEDQILLGVYSSEYGEDHEARKNAVGFVMAGGKGTRLRPLTEKTPKPLLKIGEKCLIDFTIEKMVISGINRIFVSVNYLAEQIVTHLGDGSRFGTTVEYLYEEFEMGTAGSLSLLPNNLVSQPVIVSNADILHNVSFSRLLDGHNDGNFDLTMLSMPYVVDVPFGVIKRSRNNFESIAEKPSIPMEINAGVYVLKSETAQSIQKTSRLDMPSLISRIKQTGGTVGVYAGEGPWLDIGTPESLAHAERTWHGL